MENRKKSTYCFLFYFNSLD